MPIINNYVVTQTREVSVRANSLEDAIRLAGIAFEKGQNTEGGIMSDDKDNVWGNTTSRIKETDLGAREAY